MPGSEREIMGRRRLSELLERRQGDGKIEEQKQEEKARQKKKRGEGEGGLVKEDCGKNGRGLEKV